MPTKTKAKLTTEQIEIVGQMNDLSFKNPKLTFEQAIKKRGIRFVGSNGKLSRGGKEVFERERK